MTRAALECTSIGKYRLLGHLKSGGMGAVYKAEDPDTGRLVALKMLSPESAGQPKRVERFRREARQGMRLRHAGIVAIFDCGEHEGVPFLTMEFVDGCDVEELVQRHGPLAPDDAHSVILQVAQALDYAHGRGVVHRDIKPSNILLVERHGRFVAKVADLGLARGGMDEECRVTADGATVGTVDYMAPEQARDSGLADIRSDLYALGCSLYHVLAGAPPFAEGSIIERIKKHAQVEPADLRTLNPQVSDELWAVCRRLLAKRPADRFQTPAELVAALAHLEPTAAGRPTRRPAAARPPSLEGTLDGSRSRTSAHGERRVADAQLEHALRAITAGNYDYSLTLLLNCAARDPGNLAVHQALRRAQLERLETGSTPWYTWSTRCRLQLGLWLAQRRQQPLSVLHYTVQLLCGDPNNRSLQLALARAAQDAGFGELACWLLEAAQAAHPEHPAISRDLAALLEAQGEFKRASHLWQALAAANPHDAEAQRKHRDLSARVLTNAYCAQAVPKGRRSVRATQ